MVTWFEYDNWAKSTAGSDQNFLDHWMNFVIGKKQEHQSKYYNSWFIPIGGGTNKNDANIDLGLYFKFNEGITGTQALDEIALDYSGRINNGTDCKLSCCF